MLRRSKNEKSRYERVEGSRNAGNGEKAKRGNESDKRDEAGYGRGGDGYHRIARKAAKNKPYVAMSRTQLETYDILLPYGRGL